MKAMPSPLDPGNSTFPTSSGEGYELQMGRHSRSLAPLLIAFATPHAKGKALDVGCGTGNLAVELAKNPDLTSIEAFDFSPAYIAYAKARGADPRVNFQTADACEIPFADAAFDLTLSMLVLAFIPEPQRAVREMVRVTKPGGTVAACMWDLRGGLVFGRMFWDTAAAVDPKAGGGRGKTMSRLITREGRTGRLDRSCNEPPRGSRRSRAVAFVAAGPQIDPRQLTRCRRACAVTRADDPA